MARRTPETLADYVVVAIAPLLIMFLVGSLVFFLVEVFYRGEYPLRLMWVLGLFVMATVCVTRISMEEGSSYAALFGIPLAIVVGIAVVQFVEITGPLAAVSPLINWGLLALIWWSVDRLTWDCTLVDDTQDTTNQGLLQSMGWEDAPSGGAGESQAPRLPWWRRWLGHDKRPAAHGRWVVYFSVAALPLFGLGQWFIPSSDTSGRRYAFLLLVVYVASGLGLLLTTSFLGLRRYIRQRRLEMPLEMAAAWLASGVAMIVGLLIVAALLPRPSAEFTLVPEFLQFDAPERTASRWGMGPEGAKPSPGQPPGTATGNQDTSPGPADRSKASDPSGGDHKSDKQSDGAKNGSAKEKDDQGSGSQTEEKSSQNDSGKSQQRESQPSEGKSEAGAQGGKDADEQNSGSSKQTEQQTADSGKKPEQSATEQAPAQSSKSSPPPTQPPPQPPPAPPPSFSLSSWFGAVGWLLRIVFYGVLALIAVWLAWRYRSELVAAWQHLLKELRELWERLFGARSQTEIEEAASPTPPIRRFSQYSNPFLTGEAARMSPPQLVSYSFEALEAWARDFAAPRAAGLTPHEFAEHLAASEGALGKPARQLAEIYSRMAYARMAPPAQTEAVLRSLWNAMTSLAQRPLATAGTEDKSVGSA